jgi:hypothetical protein
VITHEHEIAARFPRQIQLLDGLVVADETDRETRGNTTRRSSRS